MKSPLLEEQCKALKLGSVSRVYTQIDFESREQFLTDLFAEELKLSLIHISGGDRLWTL